MNDNDYAHSELCESDIGEDIESDKDCMPTEYEVLSSEFCNSVSEIDGSLKRKTTFKDFSEDSDQW